jgi:hypothetical protein
VDKHDRERERERQDRDRAPAPRAAGRGDGGRDKEGSVGGLGVGGTRTTLDRDGTGSTVPPPLPSAASTAGPGEGKKAASLGQGLLSDPVLPLPLPRTLGAWSMCGARAVCLTVRPPWCCSPGGCQFGLSLFGEPLKPNAPLHYTHLLRVVPVT